MKGLLVGVGIVFLIVLFLGMGYFGFIKDANAYEVNIPAQYKDMQNVFDNGTKTVMEKFGISQTYEKQVREVVLGEMTGRYGANGSQALLQMIKEDNPKVDPALLQDVSRYDETFHATFQASQTKLIALKQSYGTFLKTTTSGLIFNTIGGYPRIHCGVPDGSQDDYQIVTSDYTQKTFKEHKADALDLGQGGPK
jgi:hypothetical protein